MATEKEKWEKEFNENIDAIAQLLTGRIKKGQSIKCRNNKEKAMRLFRIANHPKAKNVEMTFFNPHPTKYSAEYVVPRDVYLMEYKGGIKEAYKSNVENMDCMIYPFPNNFDEFYKKWESLDFPMLSLIFSIDSEDKERVSVSTSITDMLNDIEESEYNIFDSLMPRNSLIITRYSDNVQYNETVDQILKDILR